MTKDTNAICGYLTKESLKNPIPPFNNQEKFEQFLQKVYGSISR
ncbi:MAG: hypothetical protein AAFY76_09680 [Cyanobacteria bacterium J06649_11]